jgi:hypothetical protein
MLIKNKKASETPDCLIDRFENKIMSNDGHMIIDDFGNPSKAPCGACWELYTDQVMGGVSRGTMIRETVAGRAALRMCGNVLLDNNGGFVQASLDLAADGSPINVSGFAGVECSVLGNNEWYNVHLRTTETSRPWQSYRQSFKASEVWRTLQLPFRDFTAHRIDTPLDLSCLRRISFVAIGREFDADLSVSRLAFFHADSSCR